MRQATYAFLVHSGLTRLSAFFNRHKVSILCFHSIALGDEHHFWPGVFISKEKLIPILDFLKQSHYTVISLQEAERHLNGEVTYENPVVITIDDGWYSSITSMLPILEQYNFPSTTYVTTYYCDHQIPVVNVLVQYWLWQTDADTIDLTFQGVKYHFSGSHITITTQVEQCLYGWEDTQKLAFLAALADYLEQDKSDITNRRFHNATYQELEKAAQNPLHDIQLHTHTHRLPKEHTAMAWEIGKNQQRLAQILSHRDTPVHFCYPSGVWKPKHVEGLANLGIHTATTLDEGLCQYGDHPLALKRNLVLDHRSLNQLRVNMSGIMDWFKRDDDQLELINPTYQEGPHD